MVTTVHQVRKYGKIVAGKERKRKFIADTEHFMAVSAFLCHIFTMEIHCVAWEASI